MRKTLWISLALLELGFSFEASAAPFLASGEEKRKELNSLRRQIVTHHESTRHLLSWI